MRYAIFSRMTKVNLKRNGYKHKKEVPFGTLICQYLTVKSQVLYYKSNNCFFLASNSSLEITFSSKRVLYFLISSAGLS